MTQDLAKIDRIDRAILHELQLDARLSNLALSERVNLSESACLRRVRRLEESGLLRGYVGLVDQSMAGYPDNVFVQITLVSQQQDDLAAFEQSVKKIPEVMECYLMSGIADYVLRVIVEDARDYERIHSQHLTRLPGVARVNSNFALRTVIKKTELPIRAVGRSGSAAAPGAKSSDQVRGRQ
ncbi:MAG: Lrp/AsnC family transcriptional regulator [Pseudomonadales bacterium]